MFEDSLHDGDLRTVKIEKYATFLQYYYNSFNFLLYLALLSCCITVMLSVTRTLALVKPLYVIRKNIVYLAFAICCFLLLIPIGTKCTVVILLLNYIKTNILVCDDPTNQLYQIIRTTGIVEMSTMLIMGTIVGLSTAISVKTLKTSNQATTGQAANNENSRKATIMILTLSILFVMINGTWGLIGAIATALYPDRCSNETTMATIIAQMFSFFFFSLNSSANPIVYIMRNSALNDYTETHLVRLTRSIATCIQMMSRLVW